ncbi:MAG: zinc-ribbon domain-containing protein [Sphingomonadaceae bacterium]|uniref:DUF3426 domain-containing protein n=1 Tax=Thermaurantiacus sp. TaxID=2820283 RepID=UPI00298F2FF8|nr:DUF3426 domain-containing protein [Thermaurantiacus sp.]MCS6987144.1 zinc-ribbon domain-containing protein [Sphingomonadaceae bacterium]MDW8415822.1 DUF3426 domain-containing protein [Thermaurantiacus sp.]
MRLACPSCGARYALPDGWADSRAAGSPKVRCRVCGHVFRLPPSPRQAPSPPAFVSTDDPPPRRPVGAWAVALAVVVGLLPGVALGVATGRWLASGGGPTGVGRLQEATQPAAQPRPPPASGLPFRVRAQVQTRRVGDTLALEVEGEIRNPAGRPLPAPRVELRLLAADGRLVDRRMWLPPVTEVLAGGGLAFRTVQLGVPVEIRKVAVALHPPPATLP